MLKNHHSSFRDELTDALKIKPIKSINRLQKVFLKSAVKIHPHQLKNSILTEGYVYILVSGHYWLYRGFDNLRLFTAKSPHIFGLTEFLIQTGGKIHVDFSLDSHLYAISYANVRREIGQAPSLWEDIAILLSFHLHYSYWRDLHLLSGSVYNSVKGKLLELEMNTDSFRDNNTILSYIRATTNISRSAIMKITKDLVDGGYIITNKGRLVKINYLPDRY